MRRKKDTPFEERLRYQIRQGKLEEQKWQRIAWSVGIATAILMLFTVLKG